MKDWLQKILMGVVLTALMVIIFLFSGCDLSTKEVMKLDLPRNCRMAIICWNKNKKSKNLASCEKYAIPCGATLSKYDLKWVPEEYKKSKK